MEHGAMLHLTCPRQRLVAPLPASTVSAFESRMAWLGLGQGLIEIDTATHRYCFGAGLDMYRAEAAVQQIAAFCQAGQTSPGAMPPSGRASS